MVNYQKGFGAVGIIFLSLGLLVTGLVTFTVISAQKEAEEVKNELTQEINSIKFPPSFRLSTSTYKPGGIDNDASISSTYDVSGTRGEVFNQVVASLGLNPADHINSTDQQLSGVGSPKYKWLFFVELNPFNSNGGFDFCSEDKIAAYEGYDKCYKEFETQRQNDPVNTVTVTIVRR